MTNFYPEIAGPKTQVERQFTEILTKDSFKKMDLYHFLLQVDRQKKFWYTDSSKSKYCHLVSPDELIGKLTSDEFRKGIPQKNMEKIKQVLSLPNINYWVTRHDLKI